MSDTKQPIDEIMPRIHAAETALHNGDAGPRFEMWSHTDPVTVFGAAFSPIGWREVAPMFEKLASNFSHCSSYRPGQLPKSFEFGRHRDPRVNRHAIHGSYNGSCNVARPAAKRRRTIAEGNECDDTWRPV